MLARLQSSQHASGLRAQGLHPSHRLNPQEALTPCVPETPRALGRPWIPRASVHPQGCMACVDPRVTPPWSL